jgi:streptogramin lyase
MKSHILAATILAVAVTSASAALEAAGWLAGASSPDTYLDATPGHLLDGSGLSNPAQATVGASLADLSGVTHVFGSGFSSSWVTNAAAGDYFASKPAPVLVFDLGSDAWLRSLVFWQYENDGGNFARSGNEARSVDVRFATSAGGMNFPGPAAVSLTLKNVHLGLDGVNSPQIISLGAGGRARYIQLTITDNYFGQPGILGGGDRVGLGEIRFNATNGVRSAIAGAPNAFELRSADAANPSLTAIDSGFNPWGLALDPEQDRVLWSDPVSGTIGWTGYGSKAGQKGTLLTQPGRVLHGVDLDCKNNSLYVLDSASDALLKLDLETMVIATLADGLFVRPNAIDHDPADGTIAVSDSGNDTVYLLDPAGDELYSWTGPSSIGAWGVACDPTSDLVFFTSHDRGELIAWLPNGGTVSTVATGLDKPRGLEIDRDGRLFCLESGNGRIVEIDRGSGAITPTDVGFAPGGRDLVIFNADDADGDLLVDEWERDQGFALCALDATDDRDDDQDSALTEMLFHGEANGGASAPGALDWLPGGDTLEARFETIASEDYDFTLLLSDDLQAWHPSAAVPSFGPAGSDLYQTRKYTIDPIAEGFTRKALFAKLIGTANTAP